MKRKILSIVLCMFLFLSIAASFSFAAAADVPVELADSFQSCEFNFGFDNAF